MSKEKHRKAIAFSLAVIVCLIQILFPLGDKNAGRAEAVTGPGDVASITASGAALAVDPSMVMTGIIMTEITTDTVTAQWEPVANATEYYIYLYNDTTQQYDFLTTVTDTFYQFTGWGIGEDNYITVAAVNSVIGCRSDFAPGTQLYTKPLPLQSFVIEGNTDTSVTLKWTDVPSATGYLIYRATGENGAFAQVGSTEAESYTDTGLESAKTYRYKIMTYAFAADNIGGETPVVSTSTLPSAPKIKIKGGEQKIRLTWNAVARASGYIVYTLQNGSYAPLIVLEGKSTKQYIQEDIPNGETHSYYVTAYRIYNNVNYESAMSNIGEAAAVHVDETSTKPKLYKDKKAFKKSNAYMKCKDFSKKVNYAKSFPIPGMVNTNVAGFACTSMVPQGIAFVKSYIMITAYDKTKVENSVIYVLEKSSRELVTTIVLPNKPHAGGITFDGKNIWITQDKTMRSIPFSAVKEGIESGEEYICVTEYNTVNTLTHKVGSAVYYKGLLWVASYNELASGVMASYEISSKGSKPELTLCKKITIPDRVQGFAFTSNGRLLLSRSCQTDSKQRGFYHHIDVYKPNLSKASEGSIKLKKLKKYYDMPSMHEELAVNGSFVYVNFESVAFPTAVNRMDRVCAMPLSYMTKLK